MIESPECDAYVPVDRLQPPAYTPSATPKPAHDDLEEEPSSDAEILLVRNKPYTSSITQTLAHLRARGGYWSRFRGMSMFLVWQMATGIVLSTVGVMLRIHNRFGMACVVILSEVLCANLHAAWVHIVISEKSERKFLQRIPSIKSWHRFAPAVAVWATASQVVSLMPRLVCGSFGSMKHLRDSSYEAGRNDFYAVAAQFTLGMLILVVLFVLLQIPASVSMVRIFASMLPEEEETIVPFDRSIGGKTTPVIVGGQGKIGMVEAWRSFPWASRMRLLKLVAKAAGIVLAFWFLCITVLVGEAYLLYGDKLGHLLKTMHGVGSH